MNGMDMQGVSESQLIFKIFPTIFETIVRERNLYMSYTMLKVASENSLVVVVVGKGHLQEIKRHWKQPIEVRDLLTIPPPKIGALKIFTTLGICHAWSRHWALQIHHSQNLARFALKENITLKKRLLVVSRNSLTLFP